MNRLLKSYIYIAGKKKITAKELAERFEVSQRTIYRDIEALSIAGIPVYTEKGRAEGSVCCPVLP